MYKYVYVRSYSSHKTKYETLEEAIDRACRDLEFGSVLPIKIEKDDEVLLSYDMLMRVLRDVTEAQRIREEQSANRKRRYRKS